MTEATILTGHRLVEWARGDSVAPARTGDGTGWADGYCGLGCRQWTRVVGIGDVSIPGLHITLSASGPHLIDPATLRRMEPGKAPRNPAPAMCSPTVHQGVLTAWTSSSEVPDVSKGVSDLRATLLA